MLFFKVVALFALNFYSGARAKRINCMQGMSIKTKGLIKIPTTGLSSNLCPDEENMCKRFDLGIDAAVSICML